MLDAPGHKDYIPNMISGAAQVITLHTDLHSIPIPPAQFHLQLPHTRASQADVAVLVVNSLVGEFEAGFSNVHTATSIYL